jgi:hypothetical protein
MDGGLSFRANLVANAAQFKARQAQISKVKGAGYSAETD